MYQVAVVLRRSRNLDRVRFDEPERERYLDQVWCMPTQEFIQDTTRTKQSLSLETASCLHGSAGSFAADCP